MKHYEDNFAHESLPSLDLQPDYVFLDLPEFQRPEMLNCVEKLLDNHIQEGRGDAICIRTFDSTWSYQDLYEKANQIAHVLVDDLGLKGVMLTPEVVASQDCVVAAVDQIRRRDRRLPLQFKNSRIRPWGL